MSNNFLKATVCAVILTSIAACGGSSNVETAAVGDVTVRQVPVSGNNATPDGKLNLFIFIPVTARPLQTRVTLVQQYLQQQGKCQLGTTDLAKLDALTRKAEGTDARALMAPLKC